MNAAEAKTIRPTNLVSGFLVTCNRTGDKGSFREIAGSGNRSFFIAHFLISHLSCGFAVIRSISCAVICCRRWRTKSDWALRTKHHTLGRGEPFGKLRASGQKAVRKVFFCLFIPERLAQTAYWTLP